MGKDYFSFISEVFDGDYKMVIELSNDLLALHKDTIDKINMAIVQDDREMLSKAVHKYKGAVVNFQYADMVYELSKIEKLIWARNLDEIIASVAIINLYILDFQNQLELYKHKYLE